MPRLLRAPTSSLLSRAALLGSLGLALSACNGRDGSSANEPGIHDHTSDGTGGEGPQTGPANTGLPKNPSGSVDTSAPEPALQVAGIFAGGNSSCALMNTGRLRCWGDNAHGELALGTTQVKGMSPQDMGAGLASVPLPPGVKIKDMQAGQTMCARSEDDVLYCWGRNSSGQLGVGNTENIGDNPGEIGKNMLGVPVGPNLPVKDYCVGSGHVCAVLGEGKVKCWGRNSQGQLGRGNTSAVGVSGSQMGELLDFVELGVTGKYKLPRKASHISCGAQHTCAVTTTNEVLCWGTNTKGQLGNGTTENVGDQPDEMGTALLVTPFTIRNKIVDIQSTQDHTCILTDAGTVHCWGANDQGQLGLGHTNNMGASSGHIVQLFSGIDLGTTSPVTQIAVGSAHACALTQDGQVRCWGANQLGELGAGQVSNLGVTPEQMGTALPTLSLGMGFVATQISAGYSHSCAKDAQGQVRCWGFNQQGQLGLGDQQERGTQASQMGDALPAVKVLP